MNTGNESTSDIIDNAYPYGSDRTDYFYPSNKQNVVFSNNINPSAIPLNNEYIPSTNQQSSNSSPSILSQPRRNPFQTGIMKRSGSYLTPSRNRRILIDKSDNSNGTTLFVRQNDSDIAQNPF